MSNDIYIFNPTCEMAVANGHISYAPPKKLQLFEQEAATYISYLATKDDYVICKQIPEEQFIESQIQAGFTPPKYININDINSLKTINSLIPWGWSPAIHHKLNNVKQFCSEAFKKSPVFIWTEAQKQIRSRKKALEILHEIKNHDDENICISHDSFPQIIQNIDELQKLLQHNPNLVVKAPWSSSGRGVLFLKGKTLKQYKENWIKGYLKQQDYLMVEPLLDVVKNITVQFEITQDKIKNLSFTSFESNEYGQFLGTNLNNIARGLTEEEASFFLQNKNYIASLIQNTLENDDDFKKYYEGYVGVDCLLVRDKKQELKIHPCLEINVRCSMGLISLFVEKNIHPDSYGTIFINHFKQEELYIMNTQNKQNMPLQIKDGKIYSGYFPLIPVYQNNIYGIWMEIYPL